jgi:type II secretory ATPase GspE/PulE/Tfp pilus assembly ATPase PilB-like protein
MVDPSNLEAIQAIEFFTGCRVQSLVALRTELLEAIEANFSRTRAMDFILAAGEASDLQVLSMGEDVDLDEDASARAAEMPPVVKLVNLVLTEALKINASDIHVDPTNRDIRIRLRVDGVLRDYLQAPAWLHSGLTSRLKVIGKLDIAEKRVPQDGRFKVRFRKRVADVRLSTLPTQFGEKAVLRLLGSSESIPDLSQLGLPAEAVKAVTDAALQPQGMIIVTGPTGSGKSTTLYSVLTQKRSAEVNIVTVEDPIEYQLEGANQVQVNVKAGLTFAGCLRSILRQDPDVILLGEVRDRETAEIAFHAAMTGHLVLTTLHTNSSVATVLRLLDLGVDPFVITSSVTLVMAQRLARCICEQCREPYSPDPSALAKLKWRGPALSFSRGRGCKACHGTGFKGRVGIFEILKMTPRVRRAINEKGSEMEIRKAATGSGFVSLMEDARDKIRNGITTAEEVLRVIQLEDGAVCADCGQPILGDTGKCMQCIESPQSHCIKCGQKLSLDWQVCPRCDTAVPRDWPPSGVSRTGASKKAAKGGREVVH